ncbi:hypothetical protein BJY01DRAFT_201332 [Aspergillus pseudoustus]|uniref:Uncharacterized protein n=1 Tax=Aspergillus pseudoustus TaxID=1810923 RepID=A0ABR4L298_9EURO
MLSSITLSGPLLLLALLIPAYLHFFTPSPTPSGPTTLVTATQKAQLEETATLLSTIYTTLAEMRYLDPVSIQTPPHNLTALYPLYQQQYNLDPSLLYLYSILPYIGPPSAGVTDFFHGSEFVDFRDPEHVVESRDPFYASPDEGADFDAENGPYMGAWVTPLSRLGNHGSVIIHDARLHRIWIVDQEGWETTDPGISEDERIAAAARVVPEPTNRNSFTHIASRPAGDVLRDINRWFRELEILPGGGENSLGWNDEELELPRLYRQNGWPDDFDGEGFEVDLARRHAWITGKDRADEPLREVESFHRMRGWLEENIARYRATIADPTSSPDEQWIARFELWRSEVFQERLLAEGGEKEKLATVRCPGGVCVQEDERVLWEAEVLRQEVKWHQQAIVSDREWADEFRESEPERAEESEMEAHVNEKKVMIYQKAYEAAIADAERRCPGTTFHSVSGKESLDPEDLPTSIRKLKEAIPKDELEIQEVQEWKAQVPDECLEAEDKVEQQVSRLVAELSHKRETLERLLGFV